MNLSLPPQAAPMQHNGVDPIARQLPAEVAEQGVAGDGAIGDRMIDWSTRRYPSSTLLSFLPVRERRGITRTRDPAHG